MREWDIALTLEEGEEIVASWRTHAKKGNKTMMTERARSARETVRHQLVLTNRRIVILGNNSYNYKGDIWEFVADIPLESIQKLGVGGRILSHAKLLTAEDEYKFEDFYIEDKSIYAQDNKKNVEDLMTKVFLVKKEKSETQPAETKISEDEKKETEYDMLAGWVGQLPLEEGERIIKISYCIAYKNGERLTTKDARSKKTNHAVFLTTKKLAIMSQKLTDSKAESFELTEEIPLESVIYRLKGKRGMLFNHVKFGTGKVNYKLDRIVNDEADEFIDKLNRALQPPEEPKPQEPEKAEIRKAEKKKPIDKKKEPMGVLEKVDAVLEDPQLHYMARTFLLLRLCQLSLRFSPDKTEHYWKQLELLKHNITRDTQKEWDNLVSEMSAKSTLVAEKVPNKGFSAEIIADVEEAKKFFASDVDEAKRRLRDCEVRLDKKHLVWEKTTGWLALTKAWLEIDRHYALKLTGKLPSSEQLEIIMEINETKPLTTEEWNMVAVSSGTKQTGEVIIGFLDDEEAELRLPKGVILDVGAHIRKSIEKREGVSDNSSLYEFMREWERRFNWYTELATRTNSMGSEQAEAVPTLLEEMFVFAANTWINTDFWYTRFHMMAQVLELGVTLKSMTPPMLERLLDRTPSHLANFVRAHYAALTASPNNVEDAYATLLSKTGQNPEAEAWFFVQLVTHNHGAEAMNLAEKSVRAESLLPRLRRALLSTDAESARAVISPADMEHDVVGEFLAQATVQDGVNYLKNATNGGAQNLPQAMWYVPTEKQLEHGPTLPLYSRCREDVKNEEQFSEYLRVFGYGEYKYQVVDAALLETLVAWSDEDSAQVRQLLDNMWETIKLNIDYIFRDSLKYKDALVMRDELLSRCLVFAADPEFLKRIVSRLGSKMFRANRELESAWKVIFPIEISKKVMEIEFNSTEFFIKAAVLVSKFSLTRRDKIVRLMFGDEAEWETAPFTKKKVDHMYNLELNLAVQLYNSDKEVLEIMPPFPLFPWFISAWQVGVIQTAIPAITEAMYEKASGKKLRKGKTSSLTELQSLINKPHTKNLTKTHLT